MAKTKRSQRLLSLLACAALLLAACAFVPAGASELPAVELTWYMPNGVQQNMQEVNDAFNVIVKEKINATVQINIIDWGAYDEKMNIMPASGEPMDLVFTSNWTNDYITNVNKGALAVIPFEKVQELCPNIIDTIPEKLWNAAKVKGELYAIPNIQVEARWPAIMLAKKYVEKYGFDVSAAKTIDDFTDFLKQIADNEPGIIPFAIEGSGGSAFLTYMISNIGLEYFGDNMAQAVYLDDDTATVVNLYETPEIAGVLDIMHNWYELGIIPKDASTKQDFVAEKANGLVAAEFAVNNPDTLPDQATRHGCTADDLVMVPLSDPFMYTGSIINTLTAVSATSKNMDRALMLFDLMFDKADIRLINLLSYGIEGKNYVKTSETQIELIPDSGYFINCGWEYGHHFLSYSLVPGKTQPELLEMETQINASAQVSKIMGFSFDPQPVKSQLAAVSAVLAEYQAGLFTGSLDPVENLPKLNDKLKAAGNDEITAEMQRQIEAWKAAQV